MKYREGDLVRIKSKTWWNKNIPHNFPENMADDCCGEIRKILNINQTNKGYLIENHQDVEYQIRSFWYSNEDWIESKVEEWKINIKYMKNEI